LEFWTVPYEVFEELWTGVPSFSIFFNITIKLIITCIRGFREFSLKELYEFKNK